jgi:hypothetical protein
LEGNGAAPKTTKCTPDGGFQMSGQFSFDCRLHARSADERHQATMFVPAILARTYLAKPVELKLIPAREFVVAVFSADKPVEDAFSLVDGGIYKISKRTNAEGIARFWIPTDEKLRSVVAWEPKLGVAGIVNDSTGILEEKTQLTLNPPHPHVVRVLDENGRPVPNLRVGVGVGLSGRNNRFEWIASNQIEQAHGLTNERGELALAWMPKENLKFVNPEVIENDTWKVDDIERDKVPEGITTLRVCRMAIVNGQLKMPADADAEGVLVLGVGYGHGSQVAFPRARTAADGSFAFAAASNHGYLLRIADLEWASGDWSGMILANANQKPAAISLEAYAATPLEVRVSRGLEHAPVPKGWISIACERPQFSWTDAQGQQQAATPQLPYWLRTDAEGSTSVGVGKGKHIIRLSMENWSEERTLEIQDGGKATVEFYRSWLKSRTIIGRLVLNGAPHSASPTTVIRIEARENRSAAIVPEIRPDGGFKFEVDASDVSIFAFDNEEQWSGLGRVEAASKTIDLAISTTAVFSGVVVDENGKPISGAQLQLGVEKMRFPAAKAQVTDGLGNFRFGAVAANLPVRLQIRRKSDDSAVHFDRLRFFLPGEVREKTRVALSRDSNDLEDVSENTKSLSDRVSGMTKDARLNGMHALVVLEGDSSEAVKKLTAAILDFEDCPEVLGFQPAVVDAKTAKFERETIKKYGWQLPEPGEVVLVALDSSAKIIGLERIAAGKLPEAIEVASALVKKHAPAPRDALARLTVAQKVAKDSGRRVWVVEGGPRCGPCFKLARWMEEQHSLLEKDYVIVKVLEGYDKSVPAVMKLLNQPEGKGIPWMAITEPDGPVLTTSDGPLGNIGFPGTIENIRHLREMLHRTASKLTAKELDQLAESLEQPEL